MNVTLRIENEDEYGNVLTPPYYNVSLEYDRIVDSNYGADADGNRGIRLVEYDITWVDPDPTIPQWAKDMAVKRFEEHPARYV